MMRGSILAAAITAAAMASVAEAATKSVPGSESVQSISVSKSWSWNGHRPRQSGELVAMGKAALEQEAARLVAEWNRAPGPVRYTLVSVQFTKNCPVYNNYRRNKLTGKRTSSAGGTAHGTMTVKVALN